MTHTEDVKAKQLMDEYAKHGMLTLHKAIRLVDLQVKEQMVHIIIVETLMEKNQFGVMLLMCLIMQLGNTVCHGKM